MTSLPLVSAGIPCYNGEKYLREAIDSVLAQTYPNLEIFVVDDGSTTDGVKNICEAYGAKVRYVRQENGGLSRARNTVIRESRGEFCAFIDDDDVWLPEKIERQVSLYRALKAQGRDPGLVYTGLIHVDPDGTQKSRSLIRAAGRARLQAAFTDFIGTPSSVLIPKKVLDRVGAFDTELVGYQDGDMWARIAREYEIFSVNEFLTRYRHREDSLSRAKVPQMMRDQERILQKTLESGRADGFLDAALERKLVRYHRWEMAKTWKEGAYRRLLHHRDSRTFREYVRRGAGCYAALFGPPTWILYLLSYFSAPLCAAAHRLKKRPSVRGRDSVRDAADLDFNPR